MGVCPTDQIQGRCLKVKECVKQKGASVEEEIKDCLKGKDGMIVFVKSIIAKDALLRTSLNRSALLGLD